KINYKANETKGLVAGIRVVDENEDLILIADDGIIIRIRVSDVNLSSRYASGVRVMRISENAKVVTFARAEHEDDVEIAQVEQLPEEDEDVSKLIELEEELEKMQETQQEDEIEQE
ncbi:MAG: DNA gyrase C-terminal beta-propeller domain-containing protein, partial [Oscillospiraceae bacterium]